MKTEHPWQTAPSEIVDLGLDMWLSGSESGCRISFLLFDLGIELIFKTFLRQPNRITGLKLNYQKRKEATEGNFHNLLNTIFISAKDKLNGIDISHIEHFHDIRNSLYHEGLLTIEKEKVDEYAKICVNLLRSFLNVDLFEKFQIPQLKSEIHKKKLALIDEIESAKLALKQLNDKMYHNSELIVELIKPNFIFPSFKEYFNQSRKRIQDVLSDQKNFISVKDFDKRIEEILDQELDILKFDSTNEMEKTLFKHCTSYEEFILDLVNIYVFNSKYVRKNMDLGVVSSIFHTNTGYIEDPISIEKQSLEKISLKRLENFITLIRQRIPYTEKTIAELQKWYEQNKSN